MKYSIKINQKAIIDNWFDLDVIDGAILNYIEDFSKSSKLRKTIIEWVEYFRIQYEHMIEEMPMLWIKNRQALRKRVNKLVDCWILEKHLLNWNSTYFRFWEKYDLIISDTPVENKDVDGGKLKSLGGVNSKVEGGKLKSLGIKHSTNNSTNNINNTIVNSATSPTEKGGRKDAVEGSNTLLNKVINHWNSIDKIWNAKWLPQCRRITKDITEEWDKIYKKYTPEDIALWFNNYINEIKWRWKWKWSWWYYNHRFSFYKFIKQWNWLKEFINQ